MSSFFEKLRSSIDNQEEEYEEYEGGKEQQQQQSQDKNKKTKKVSVSSSGKEEKDKISSKEDSDWFELQGELAVDVLSLIHISEPTRPY